MNNNTDSNSTDGGKSLVAVINPLQDPNTLLTIVITATVIGLVLLTLIALSFIYLISKYCNLNWFHRRRQLKVNSDRNGHSQTLSYERYTDVPDKPLNHSSTQRQITTSQLELELFTDKDGKSKSYQTDDKQPLVLGDLPSPPDPAEHDIIGLDTLQRTSWSQRNTSFRLAQDAKQQLIQKYQNGNRKSIPIDSDDSDMEEFLKGLPKLPPKPANPNIQPDRVATVKTANSLKSHTYDSFREHMKQFDNQGRRAGGNVKVLPPSISGKQAETTPTTVTDKAELLSRHDSTSTENTVSSP